MYYIFMDSRIRWMLLRRATFLVTMDSRSCRLHNKQNEGKDQMDPHATNLVSP
jgi:hypothetical protein